MKQILKFFPAAFAVLALASCSNDDFLGNNEEIAQREPGKLYVQVEDLKDGMSDGTTRAGFVYGTTASGGSHGQYLVWNQGDKVKIYDDNKNWRPQVWEYDEAATKAYKKEDGFSVFSEIKTVAGETATETPTQYTNAYGVYPATLGKFTNENRSELEFNLSSLANYKLNRTAVTDVYADGYLAKLPIPLWGVATSADGSSEMKVKYLTGVLKVDIGQLPATTGTKHNWLAVQSKVAGGKVANLHPATVTTDFAPESVEKAPELAVDVTTGTATDLSTDYTIGNNASDIILVDLGTNLATATPSLVGKRCCIAVPIVVAVDGTTPVEQEISAYLYTEITNNATQLTASTKQQVGETIKKTVASGTQYLIQTMGAYALDGVNSLNLLEQKIAELDAASDRDLTITLNEDIPVKNGDDPDAFTLTVPTLKNNVTVQFAASKGLKKDAIGGDLVIKTTGGKTLTFVNSNSSTITSVKAVEDVNGPLVLKGDYTTNTQTIVAGSEKLTIAASATKVEGVGTVVIDNADATITKLEVQKGCTAIALNNGIINEITFSNADGKKIEANVAVTSTGKSAIKTVDKTNIPEYATAGHDRYQITFSSTWDATTSKYTGETNIANGNIYTAAQLASISGNGTYNYKLMGNINLNGKDWSPVVLQKSFEGADVNANYYTSDAAAGKVAAAYPTISGLTVAAADANGTGLFSKITAGTAGAYVKNITLSGVTITDAAYNNLGALAGIIDGTNGLTISNVKLAGENSIQATGLAQNIGALVGSIRNTDATSGVSFVNVAVGGTTTIKGYAGLGGLIGEVNNAAQKVVIAAANAAGTATTTYAATNTYNSVAGITFAQNQDTDYDYDPALAKIGDYIGTITVAASALPDVDIYVDNMPTAFTRPDQTKAKFTIVSSGKANYYAIGSDQTLIGLSAIDYNSNPAMFTGVTVDTDVAEITTITGAGTTASPYTYTTTGYKVKLSTPARGTSGVDFGKNFLNWIVK